MTLPDRAAQLLSNEYELVPKGTSSAFCRLFFLLESLTGLPDAEVYAGMQKMFPLEVAAFEGDALPIKPMYAERFTIRFPELN